MFESIHLFDSLKKLEVNHWLKLNTEFERVVYRQFSAVSKNYLKDFLNSLLKNAVQKSSHPVLVEKIYTQNRIKNRPVPFFFIMPLFSE